MRRNASLVSLALVLSVACSGASSEEPSARPAPAPSAEPTPAPPEAEPAPAEPAEAEPTAQPTTGGAVCGTRGATQCAAGTFCNYAPGSNCGADDRGGQCEPIPEVCTREYMPVCGCDGQTHATACVAHSHGVAVAHDGPC